MALSGLMVVIISSTEQIKVEFIAKWLSGNVWGADWPFVLAILPWLVVLIPFTLYKANRLNILRLSEQVAIGVGISLEKERLFYAACFSCACGISSFCDRRNILYRAHGSTHCKKLGGT